MLIAIIGENCVGKSTLASKVNEKLCGKIYSGKDYLRLEKNPSVAVETFKSILTDWKFWKPVSPLPHRNSIASCSQW